MGIPFVFNLKRFILHLGYFDGFVLLKLVYVTRKLDSFVFNLPLAYFSAHGQYPLNVFAIPNTINQSEFFKIYVKERHHLATMSNFMTLDHIQIMGVNGKGIGLYTIYSLLFIASYASNIA